MKKNPPNNCIKFEELVLVEITQLRHRFSVIY